MLSLSLTLIPCVHIFIGFVVDKFKEKNTHTRLRTMDENESNGVEHADQTAEENADQSQAIARRGQWNDALRGIAKIALSDDVSIA